MAGSRRRGSSLEERLLAIRATSAIEPDPPGEPEPLCERVLSLLSQHVAFDWAALIEASAQGGDVRSAWQKRPDGTLDAERRSFRRHPIDGAGHMELR